MGIFRVKIWILISLLLILSIFGTWIYLRFFWFFRDPPRKPEATERAIVSPADGQIVYIRKFENGRVVSEKQGERIELEEISKLDLKEEDGWLIGIYMSPLDVHYNYAPISGRVEKVFHYSARANLPMVDLWEYLRLTYLRQAVNLFSKKFHLRNERETLFIKGEDIEVVVVEIADKFVNKIDRFVDEGESVRAGQKISFIRRGSQVDILIFKKDLDIQVEFGKQVYGGQTVLAFY